jgi:hypothetical protein
MDERLEKALQFSNYMVNLNNQKRILEETYHQDIIHYFNGAQFTVDKELIVFCKIMMDLEQEVVVLVDDNKRPVEIDNLSEFFDEILTIYNEASNEYHVNYTTLIKSKQKMHDVVLTEVSTEEI